MRTTFYDYCVDHGETALLAQWHPERNGTLTPRDVSYGSKRRVWWACERGHAWQAVVYTRTGGAGCPYCTGKRAWSGENDLASTHPDLAAQWHPTKNRGVAPADVLPGSHYKAWWACERGHEWRAMVKSRVSGTGCAPPARTGGWFPAKTTWPPPIPAWRPSGTRRKTGR